MNYTSLNIQFPTLFDNEDGILKLILLPESIKKWQKRRRKELLKLGLPTSWAKIGILLDDPYWIILRDLIQFPDGSQRGYTRMVFRTDLEGGESVAVLPSYKNEILLLRQFRHATRSWHYEIPRGYGEPGIEGKKQAQKEIQEEVGGQIDEPIDLGILHHNTGVDGSHVRLFFGRLNSIGRPQKEEAIEEFYMAPIDKLELMISNGEITDGFTIAAYTRAKLRGLL
jgi:ADP-ribose pyrophosphatase